MIIRPELIILKLKKLKYTGSERRTALAVNRLDSSKDRRTLYHMAALTGLLNFSLFSVKL